MAKIWLAFTSLLFVLICRSIADTTSDRLKIAYQWKQMNYECPDSENQSDFFPKYSQPDNVPLGLEVAGDRIFITIPKWTHGVAATLNYININDTRDSPPLKPYPSCEAHQWNSNEAPEIISPFRVRADRCNRLWVLDAARTPKTIITDTPLPPALLIYDLSNDTLIEKYIIPEDQRTNVSLFANLVVEDYSCDDAYGYLGDMGGSSGIVVYSLKKNESWLVKHSFFAPDPEAKFFNASGLSFNWTWGLLGMALAPASDGYSTIYFHPLTSTMEFSVSTKILRHARQVNSSGTSLDGFEKIANRGVQQQSSLSFFDKESQVLFYGLIQTNAIACWKIGNKFSLDQQGVIYTNNVTMDFPSDLKIDSKGNIWIISDKLPAYMHSKLDPEDYNFRILTGSAREAINDTVCAKDLSSYAQRNAKVHEIIFVTFIIPFLIQYFLQKY